MIGKVTVGKSFKGCLLYCLNDKKQDIQTQDVMKGRAKILMFNQCYGNAKELIAQFHDVRQLNPKLSKPVLHITLSLAPGERLSNDKLMEITQQCAHDMGFENNQYVAISHNDTSHQHLHIVANRVGLDKRTVSDSQSYKKIATFCRKIELKYGLKQVLNPGRYLSREQRQIPRSDQRKNQIKEHIRQTLNESRYYHEFEQKMKAKGYQVIKGRGISFIDKKKVKVKGSEVNYSLQTIERILEKNRLLELKQAPGNLKMQEQIEQSKPGLKSEPHGLAEKEKLKLENDNSVVKDLLKDLTKITFDVMKSEQSMDLPQKEFQQKKKRKKRLRPSGH